MEEPVLSHEPSGNIDQVIAPIVVKVDRMQKAREALAKKRALRTLERLKSKLQTVEELPPIETEEKIQDKPITEEIVAPAIEIPSSTTIPIAPIIEPIFVAPEKIIPPIPMSSSDDIEVKEVPLHFPKSKHKKSKRIKKRKRHHKSEEESDSEEIQEEPPRKKRKQDKKNEVVPTPPVPDGYITVGINKARDIISGIEVTDILTDALRSAASSLGMGAVVIVAVMARGYVQHYLVPRRDARHYGPPPADNKPPAHYAVNLAPPLQNHQRSPYTFHK